MANSGIEIQGLDEINRKLQSLPEKLRRKYVRESLLAAANIVRDEARRRAKKALVPTRPDLGHMADHIESKVWVTLYRANATVGVDWVTHSYGHLVEFGHKLPGGGETKKQPFMRPAFDNKSREALDRLLTDLRDAVEKEASNGS
jgi:HK97 gp10 family phage protein